MVGWHTRVSSVVAVLMMMVLQRANTAIFNSGDLLLRQIGVCVALAPCGLLWSLDARRARRKGRVRNLLRAPYGMRFLQLSLALGYFLSAWSKSRGHTWHDGTAIALSLRIEDLQRYVAPEWLFEQRVLLNLFTWATLAFEATFFALVWNRRLRPWVLAIGVAFHLGIDIFLDIGFFSIAIYLAYLAFLPDESPTRSSEGSTNEPSSWTQPTRASRRAGRGCPGGGRGGQRLRRSPPPGRGRLRRTRPAMSAPVGVPYSSEELAEGERRGPTDPVEPSEEDGDRPGVVAHPVAGAVHDAELGVAVGVDEDPSVEHGNEVVVAAVDHEERARGATFGAQATARISRSSRVHASTSAGKVGSVMMPTSRACSSRRLGCDAQSSKSAGAPRVATPRTSGSAAAAHSAERAARAEAGQPHAR